MKYKDYYETLGVTRTATLDEIKKAYRKLAHQYHPDVSSDPEGEEKFKAVAEAYGTLKDKEKRQAYDELGRHADGQEFQPGQSWSRQHNGQAGNGNGSQGYSFDESDFSELFANFAAGRNKPRPAPGQDYELSTEISLEQAYTGTTVDLNFTVEEMVAETGRRRRAPHSLTVRIPQGVSDGQKMLLRGKGAQGMHGGRNGNLYLTIRFLPHRLFRAAEHDLFIDLPLSPWEAALGATVKVPTLAGAVNLKIPAGTTSGQKLRIGKRGLPKNKTEHGDLFAVTQIVLPASVSEKEQALLQELAQISTFNPRLHFE